MRERGREGGRAQHRLHREGALDLISAMERSRKRKKKEGRKEGMTKGEEGKKERKPTKERKIHERR